MVVDLLRSADLRDSARVHHDDSVGHGHGLLAVVRDMDRREAEPALQCLDLGAKLDAHLGVKIGQGLVEQQDFRLDGEGPPQGHALPLAARQIGHLAVFQPRQVQHLQHGGDPGADLVPRHPAQPEAVAHVAENGHVRPERVGLEHHGHAALLRRRVHHIPPEQADRARRRLLEAGDGAQQRGLPAAG